MVELWLPVAGFPSYSVSDLGRVRFEGRDQNVCDRLGRVYVRTHKPKLRKITYSAGHYGVVTLYNDGRRASVPVHRAVALAFLGPCPAGLEVRHLDGDLRNNAASNLKYGTRQENIADKAQHGTLLKGDAAPGAKLTREQAEEIIRRRAAGETCRALADLFGISPMQVSRIARGLRWPELAGYATLTADRLKKAGE